MPPNLAQKQNRLPKTISLSQACSRIAGRCFKEHDLINTPYVLYNIMENNKL